MYRMLACKSTEVRQTERVKCTYSTFVLNFPIWLQNWLPFRALNLPYVSSSPSTSHPLQLYHTPFVCMPRICQGRAKSSFLIVYLFCTASLPFFRKQFCCSLLLLDKIMQIAQIKLLYNGWSAFPYCLPFVTQDLRAFKSFMCLIVI